MRLYYKDIRFVLSVQTRLSARMCVMSYGLMLFGALETVLSLVTSHIDGRSHCPLSGWSGAVASLRFVCDRVILPNPL